MIKHKLCVNKLCGHEWDGNRLVCDWCGSKGTTIEEFQKNWFTKLQIECLLSQIRKEL